jgi:Cd2+/Zn2+-exporting ATPase
MTDTGITDVRRWLLSHRKLLTTAVSGVLFAVGWSLVYVGYGVSGDVALLVAAFVGGYDVAKKAYHTLRNGTVDINALVTLAAVGAIGIGEYWEAAGVVFLFSLGGYLEGRTMRRTRAALQELLERAPDTAVVRRDGKEVELPAHEVEEGEVVVVRPGDSIPVDGVVTRGESAVDQSSVTGESAPVRKTEDDEVYAGTVNRDGALDVRATGTGSDTTLQRIIRRVEEAQEAKSPTETLVEKFAKYYTPAVVLLAVGTYVVTRDAMVSLTLLVIGCPGALVIGPPVSIVSAIGNSARNGVLMKGGEHLERAGKIDLVAFDKTGTLTKGETVVSEVRGFGVTDEEALRHAAVAERRSEHHLADAVLDEYRGRDGYATDGGVSVAEHRFPEPETFEVEAGKGVTATYNGRRVLVGNSLFLKDEGVEVPQEVAEYSADREKEGETAVYVAVDASVVGVISLRDEARDATADVVEELKDDGVRTVMLTGDNERTARAVAEEAGIDEYHAELLPEDKQEIVEELRGEGNVVAMVGDGINDAPSLAVADVGVAMGAAGTDTAIETADTALMADDLRRIPYAVGLSKATRRNIVENVGIAVATVVVLLAGVFTGYVTMATGMLAHIVSVLVVIMNGMRLTWYR